MKCLCGNEIPVDNGKYQQYYVCSKCGHFYNRPYYLCCQKPNLDFIQYRQSNNVIVVREHCKNCDNIFGKSYKKADHPNINSYPVLDFNDAEKRSKLYTEEYKYFSELALQKRNYASGVQKQLFRKFYEDYLKTEEWRRRRLKILQRDSHICQGCLKNKATQVHHLTYEHLGCEFAFELISICEPCHKRLHTK